MSQSSRWIALVALAEPSPPNGPQLVDEIARLFPHHPVPQISSQTPAAVTIALGATQEVTLNVTLVDKPIPWSRLEGPCATAWYWPEAESALRSHRAHLFVTMLDEGSKAIQQAQRLTSLLTAVAAVSPARGLVWGPTGAVHQPRDFANLAATATPENLPLNLWIDFRVFEGDPAPGTDRPQYGLFTTGMESFGYREFEAPGYQGDPQQLVSAAYNIAHYALEKRASLQDAEVIGLPDESQVTLREAKSVIDPEQDVMVLEFNA
ncbi:DUF4261 domain-containing protein [Botrimarina hoheduenensis]|uniref:DUF4261 domain-containing protein n=1 Tax=Botrimarina hoheduenensis TaxID=2528000 RepID=A0A5C5VZI2_9BACT|nr:DUF4261 domain-containing protein [Botrimarina hoheduenensis]TWT43199.1 hypothetical protein Pla111_21490 [Botrimarina hoheduenensis]